jgi:hypothetical protein
MTTFDDRERAFEAKFAQDQDAEFRLTARRNRLFGLWAAEKMQLSEQGAEQYAAAVIRADFAEVGDEDVLRKVSEDLKAAGVTVRQSELAQKLDECLAVARQQIETGEAA